MKVRNTSSVMIACIVLLGCASPGQPGGGMQRTHADCTGASCQITVKVDCTATPCIATAFPKELDVLTPNGTKVIHWKLDAPDGYAFADEKVAFASGAPFNCTPPGAGRKEVTCVDNHAGPGEYGYTLAAVKVGDPGSRIPVDPWIVNR